MYRAIAVTAALGVGMFTACAGPVAVPAPQPSSAQVTEACEQLNSALPSSVLTAVRRTTDPQTPTTAAWGDPPITLRCGVEKPPELEPTSTLLTVDGVDWLPVTRSAGYVFTAVGRVTYVEVAVPNSYAPETEVLPGLSGAVSSSIAVAPK